MSLEKITEQQMNEKGVCAAPNILNGTPAENKAIFDRMVRQVVAPAYNACVDAVEEINAQQEKWGEAEAGRVTAEDGRVTAEEGRVAAEIQREQNEAARQTTETARQTAEQTRNSQETDRQTAEQARKDAEAARVAAENQRALNETDRQTAEETRRQTETQRKNAEADRANAESVRIESENTRVTNENTRVIAEDQRVIAEAARNVWEDYNEAKAYVPGNKVYWRGNSYVCLRECAGVTPENASYWQTVVHSGFTEDSLFSFDVVDGRLICYYQGDNPPPFHIGEDGHLYADTGSGKATDLGKVANIDAEVADAEAARDKAKEYADAAAESAAVYDNVVADVTQLKQDVAAITPDDTAVDGKPWTSKHIVDSLCQPIEESGNPVQCYPVENYPLGVKVSWEPVQEGSGDPSPDNIRPIKGRDSVSITHTGKNIIPYPYEKIKKVGDSYTENGITYTLLNDGAIHIAGIPESKFGLTIAINNLSRFGKLAKSGRIFYDSSNNRIFIYPLTPGQKVNETVYPQIEVGTTATSYEAPMGHRITTLTLPETVYGGDVDAVSGEGQETWKILTLDGTEEWGKYGSVSEKAGASCFSLTINDKYIGYGTSVCNKFVNTKNSDPFNSVNMKKFTYTDHPGLRNVYMNYGDDQTVSLDEWKSYLAAQYAAGTPVQICYKLAEPVPFTATGTQPIPALSGVNTIYTDSDSVVVTGAEDPKHTITELKNAIISLGGNV